MPATSRPTTSPPVHPTGIARLDVSRVAIDWSDGGRTEHSAAQLREACPCATCREKRSAPPPPANVLPVLSAAEARPLEIVGMTPVGSYAYRVDFSDGHNTGLFNFDLLRGLGGDAP
ncbi:MAG: DUF971 domain-containing protein [Planctomycetota bacterium]